MFKTLTGNPYSDGKTIGKLGRSVFMARVRQVRKIQKAKRVPSRILQARAKDWINLVAGLAPGWLDEIKGTSEGAGLDSMDIALLNCLPPDFYPAASLEAHCTSFLSVSEKQTRLLKIRDERNFPQSFFITRTGGSLLQAGRDMGNTGYAHFFRQNGLSGANNTGSHTVNSTDKPLLNDCHVLRLIAERAESAASIPLIMEQLIAKKAVAGASSTRGAIYLYADRECGLLVEADTENFNTRFIDDGLLVAANHFITTGGRRFQSKAPDRNTLAREKRMLELLSGIKNSFTPMDIFSMTRDRKNRPYCLCRDDKLSFPMTVSAQYHTIDRLNPENSINYMCCGNPRHSVYIPVPAGFAKSFVPIINGSFYKVADALYRKHVCKTEPPAEVMEFESTAAEKGNSTEGLFEKAYDILLSAAEREQNDN